MDKGIWKLGLANLGHAPEAERFIMMMLLLWDIDGTLIDSGGAGERALRFAMEREFGLTEDLGWLELAGRTDRWIATQILARYGLETTDKNIRRFLDAYLATVGEEMANPRARVLPGVRAALDAVSQRKDVAQALLTGNLQIGAKIKLSHFDLWKYFPFGAFADDSDLRNELGPHALRRAADHHKIPFLPERVIVIGDTPHDIACGKAIGAKTLAVATGRFSPAALEPFSPDIVLQSLEDTNAFLESIDRVCRR
ncbi:MAG TPA: HAD family hydrolase [Opitutaceae bacterium]|nr:HAD family hydrolase [Opitutaceae bacterium]